jgi:hypothetical protein
MAVEVSDEARQFCMGGVCLTVSKHVLVQLQRYHQIPPTSSQYPHNDIMVYGDYRIVSMLPIMSSGDETGIESPNPSQPARDNRGLSPQPESGLGPGPGPVPAQTQRIEVAAPPVRRLQRRPSADQEPISSQSTQKADQPGYGGSAGHARQNFELPGITSWWPLDSNRGANHPSNTAPVVGEPVSMYQSSGHTVGLREVEISPSGALSTSTAGERPFERYSYTKLIF